MTMNPPPPVEDVGGLERKGIGSPGLVDVLLIAVIVGCAIAVYSWCG